MANRYIEKVTNIAQVRNLPNAAGIGVFGNVPYYNTGAGPVPLGALGLGQSGKILYVNSAVTGAYTLIQDAIDDAGQGDTILIAPKEGDASAGDTDPDSYTEALTLGSGKDGVSLVGICRGLAQGGQPQLRIGSGSSPHITVEAFGCGIFGLTINGASNTGGGVKIVADGSTKDAGGLVIGGCHFKNCKGSAAGLTGGAIYWTSSGGAWYVSIYGCEFIDNRAGIVMIGTGISVPQHVKIVGNRFSVDPNTDNDADILVAADGIKNLIIDNNVFGTVDVPGYATSPDAARYIKLATGTTGIISNCVFACISEGGSQKTFGATGTAVIAPTTVRMARNYGESATTDTSGEVFRT